MSKKKTVQTAALQDNEHVKELLALLKENSVSAKDVLEVLDYVGSMESNLTKLAAELSSVRRELADMRNIQEHPAKHAFENAARTMEKNISVMQERINGIKESIIESCKNAVTAFKEKGIEALSNLASFFHIKEGFLSLRENLESNIRSSDKAIERIEAVSDAYHEAGRRIKNVGRALADKELIEDAKPSGKLANLLEAPFRREKESYTHALRDVNKTIDRLERLEASAEKVRDSRTSVIANIREHKEQSARSKPDAPTAVKNKVKEASL